MSDLLSGTVVKAWSNWYEVQTAGGRFSCQPRGRLRRAAALLVGDRVELRPLEGGEGAIEGVQPRRNALERPQVANVDAVAVVACWTAPPWSAELVDRVLVHAEAADCAGLLVLNKSDLLTPGEREAADAAVAPYRAAGYPVLFTSAVVEDGLAGLRAAFSGRVLVLAGASGAGKSRLLTALAGDAAVRSGSLSTRRGRGRHTTRHAELLSVGDGWLVDTPGFSRLDVGDVDPARLAACFPEIAARAADCRFRGCRHHDEPGCAVRGAIDAGRHARYLRLLRECEQQPRVVAQRSPRPRTGDAAWDEAQDEDLDDLDREDLDREDLDRDEPRGAGLDPDEPSGDEPSGDEPSGDGVDPVEPGPDGQPAGAAAGDRAPAGRDRRRGEGDR